MMTSHKSQTTDLTSLSAQQLSQVKKQLDDELEHLTNSFTQLRAVQAKFRECIKSIASGVTPKDERKPILIPLTASLYLSGVLADTSNVIVDVGTGFYVEKTSEEATKFYDRKVEELGANLKDLERIVQGKSSNLRIVEDVLREKILNNSSI